MDHQQFTSVLDRYSHLKLDEVSELTQFRSQWPYCQIFPVILARYAKDENRPNQKLALQAAAVWATDRGLLRELMIADDRTDEAEVTEVIRRVDLADEIIKDLKRLKQLKLQFEQLYDQMPASAEAAPLKKRAGNAHVRRTKSGTKNEETIITEIKSRKKLKPASEKQKAQLEVIDEFIKTKPRIKPASSKSPESANIPEPENLVEFNENVVSETLVDILVKQEKWEKAIEVLKKLIWKFPQKKAYFAAKIEELRK